MAQDMLSQTLKAVAQALEGIGVDILLIGGFAVNHYGYTRATLDVDFMLAADDFETVKHALIKAGFTNFSLLENVAFFQRPESSVRVDFIKTDRETVAVIQSRALQTIWHGIPLRIPSLADLLAMKLFAVAHGTRERYEKDLQDVVQLCLLNDFALDPDLHGLCTKYASERVYQELCQRINNLKKI